jgi:hypothetical protein
MPPKRCCCSSTCLFGQDDFNRANENPVTGQWHEVSGDWEIDSNELNCITEGPLITLYRQPAPKRVGNGYNSRIVVDLVVPASGDAEWKIITAYRSSTDYNWIHLEYDGTTGELTPTFYLNATEIMSTTTHPGGELWTPSPGTNFTVEICCSFIEWTITNVGLQSDIIWHTCEDSGLTSLPTPPLGGQGLLYGRFDNWLHYIHWESDSTCDKCQCFCQNPDNKNDYKCLPETLYLTLTPEQVTPSCSLDGAELEMYLSEPDVSGATPVYDATPIRKRWYSELFTCEGETLWFVLVCDNDYPLALSLLAYPNVDPDDASTTNVFLNDGALGKLVLPLTAECNPVLIEYDAIVDTATTTCDLDPGPGTGVRPLCCDGCWVDGTEPDPRWSITITE